MISSLGDHNSVTSSPSDAEHRTHCQHISYCPLTMVLPHPPGSPVFWSATLVSLSSLWGAVLCFTSRGWEELIRESLIVIYVQ